MIDIGLTEEYLLGYNARLKNQSFDENKPDDWKMGWMNANQALKADAERK